jgi:hypothetical protein
MRVAGCLAVSMIAASVAVGGLIVAPAASAKCEARNGAMLCDDPPPAPSAPAPKPVTVGCDWDWYCDDFGLDIVIGKNDSSQDGDNSGRPPRPRPPRPN